MLQSEAICKASSLTVLQEKVACLADNDARLALGLNNIYIIHIKPHGHGDVHALLYSSGLLKEWKVSASKEYHVNSLVVPRKAKEANRGITNLTHKDDTVHLGKASFFLIVHSSLKSDCTITQLFEKVLSASDAGRIGRLVLPKACAKVGVNPTSIDLTP
nr:UDP-sugar pyrophosphorylase-like [Tanacetum cinerariifolium]